MSERVLIRVFTIRSYLGRIIVFFFVINLPVARCVVFKGVIFFILLRVRYVFAVLFIASRERNYREGQFVGDVSSG